MLLDQPATPEQIAALVELIRRWVAGPPFGVSAVDYIAEERRWLIRMRGEEKTFITVWLTLGERTLQYETYFMPAPEENIQACWEYLLRVNHRLFGMRFAVGAEDAVYLMGQLPLRAVDDEVLDAVVGSAYAYSEEYFAPAMSIGFASKYRRPHAKSG